MRQKLYCQIVLWPMVGAALLLPLTSCNSKKEPMVAPITFVTPTPVPTADLAKVLAAVQTAAAEPDADGIELVSVGLAPELAQVVVFFKGPPELINGWWQGSVYVVDEARGMIYKDIPIAPLIGPLLGKPKEANQLGYAMLSNFDQGVKVGTELTVVLGNYKREHIKVE